MRRLVGVGGRDRSDKFRLSRVATCRHGDDAAVVEVTSIGEAVNRVEQRSRRQKKDQPLFSIWFPMQCNGKQIEPRCQAGSYIAGPVYRRMRCNFTRFRIFPLTHSHCHIHALSSSNFSPLSRSCNVPAPIGGLIHTTEMSEHLRLSESSASNWTAERSRVAREETEMC